MSGNEESWSLSPRETHSAGPDDRHAGNAGFQVLQLQAVLMAANALVDEGGDVDDLAQGRYRGKEQDKKMKREERKEKRDEEMKEKSQR